MPKYRLFQKKKLSKKNFWAFSNKLLHKFMIYSMLYFGILNILILKTMVLSKWDESQNHCFLIN